MKTFDGHVGGYVFPEYLRITMISHWDVAWAGISRSIRWRGINYPAPSGWKTAILNWS